MLRKSQMSFATLHLWGAFFVKTDEEATYLSFEVSRTMLAKDCCYYSTSLLCVFYPFSHHGGRHYGSETDVAFSENVNMHKDWRGKLSFQLITGSTASKHARIVLLTPFGYSYNALQ